MNSFDKLTIKASALNMRLFIGYSIMTILIICIVYILSYERKRVSNINADIYRIELVRKIMHSIHILLMR